MEGIVISAKSPFGRWLEDRIPKGEKGKFAAKVGASPQTLSRWINTGQIPKLAYLQRIAEVFGVSLESIPVEEHSRRSLGVPIVGPAAPGVGLAEAQPDDEDPMMQRIKELEAASALGGETSKALLLLTARRVRELERQVAQHARAIREGRPAREAGESDDQVLVKTADG